jgi:predicted nucleic acid-binding Zn ribbon protein
LSDNFLTTIISIDKGEVFCVEHCKLFNVQNEPIIQTVIVVRDWITEKTLENIGEEKNRTIIVEFSDRCGKILFFKKNRGSP